MVNDEVVGQLSERELEVLTKIAAGASNKQIAQELFLSIHTVKVHVRNIHSKLGVQSRTEAAMLAVQSGLIILPGMTMLPATIPMAEVDELNLETDPELKVTVIAEETVTESLSQPDSFIPIETVLPLSVEPVTIEATPLKSYLITNTSLAWWQPIYMIAVILVAGLVAVLPILPVKKAPPPRPTITIPGPISKQVTPTPTAAPPVPKNWAYHVPLNMARANFALVAFQDNIFAIGGSAGENIATRRLDSYNIATKKWTERTNTLTATASAMAVILENKIYLPGGCNDNGQALTILQIYDPNSDSWSSGPALPAPRCAYGLIAFSDKLYLFGGWDGKKFTDTVLVYTPKTKQWRTLTPPMPEAMGNLGVAILDEQIYIVGGTNGQNSLNQLYQFNPETESWTKKATMLAPREGLGLVAVAHHLFVIGGNNPDTTIMGEEYDPQADKWVEFETPITFGWRNMGMAVLDTQFFAMGGVNDEGTKLDISISYEAIHHIFIPFSSFQPK
jgi:DNA-binding CsgD family transcriptional regulator/N-acetylneuraminic acid mutarotase